MYEINYLFPCIKCRQEETEQMIEFCTKECNKEIFLFLKVCIKEKSMETTKNEPSLVTGSYADD